MNEVSIFDNLNTFITYITEIGVNVVHGLRAIPDIIGQGLVKTAEVTEHFPPFVTWLVMFVTFTAITMKVSHWG